jgi:hypothetical protein
VDPPKLNPRPSQHVKLNVIAAPSLNVRVGASYRIGFWLGLLGGGGEYCGPDVHAPAGGVSHPRPGTTVPIDLKWDGRGYEGEFYIDHFLPGRCHRRFFSLATCEWVMTCCEWQPNELGGRAAICHLESRSFFLAWR